MFSFIRALKGTDGKKEQHTNTNRVLSLSLDIQAYREQSYRELITIIVQSSSVPDDDYIADIVNAVS